MRFLLPPSLGQAKSAASARLLRAVLTSWSGAPIEVAVAADYRDMLRQLERSEAHMAWVPPAVCATIASRARTILKSIRHGSTTYRAALVVRRGTVQRLEELRGTRAAWVDRLSTAGYLLAAALLRQRGFDPDTLFAEQRFVGSYRKALRLLAAGEVEVTSIYLRDESADCAERMIHEILRDRSTGFTTLAITDATPNDGLVLTKACTAAEAGDLSQRLRASAPRMLLESLSVDGFLEAGPQEYDVLAHPD